MSSAQESKNILAQQRKNDNTYTKKNRGENLRMKKRGTRKNKLRPKIIPRGDILKHCHERNVLCHTEHRCRYRVEFQKKWRLKYAHGPYHINTAHCFLCKS